MENNNIFTDDVVADDAQSATTADIQSDVSSLFTDTEYDEFSYMDEFGETGDTESLDDLDASNLYTDEEVDMAFQQAVVILNQKGYAVDTGAPRELIMALTEEMDKDDSEEINVLNTLYQDQKRAILEELGYLAINERNSTSVNKTSTDEILSAKVHSVVHALKDQGYTQQEILEELTSIFANKSMAGNTAAAYKYAVEELDKYMCSTHDSTQEDAELDNSDMEYVKGWQDRINEVFTEFSHEAPITKFIYRNGSLYCKCPHCGTKITMDYAPFVTFYYKKAYNTMSSIRCTNPECNESLHVSLALAHRKLKSLSEMRHHVDLAFPAICHYAEDPKDYLYDSGKSAQVTWKIRHLDLRNEFDDYRYNTCGSNDKLDIMLCRISEQGSVDILTSIIHNIYGVCRILDNNFSEACVSPGYSLSVSSDIAFVENLDKFDLIGADLQDVLKAFKCNTVEELKQFKPKVVTENERSAFINDLNNSWTFASVVRPVTTLKAEIAMKWLIGDMVDPIIKSAKMATLLQHADILYSSEKEQAALNFATLDAALASLKRTANTEIIRHYYSEFTTMGKNDSSNSAPITVSSYATRYKPMCIPLFGALCVHESMYAMGISLDDYTAKVRDHLKVNVIEQMSLLVCKNYYSEIAPHLSKICENETYTAWNIPEYKSVSGYITKILAEEKIDDDTYGFSNPKFVVEELKLQTGEEW